MVGQGNLERAWNVMEKSGNLKINGYCSLQKLTYSVQGEIMYFLVRYSRHISL